MATNLTPTDAPIPATGEISFSRLRDTFGNAAHADVAEFKLSDLQPQTGLSLGQTSNDLAVSFFRGKNLPDPTVDFNRPSVSSNASYETVDTTWTNGGDFNFRKRFIRTAAVDSTNTSVVIPETKRGIGRLVSGVLKTSNMTIANTHTAQATAQTLTRESAPLTVQIRKRNYMVKTINDSMDTTDVVIPMQVRFAINTTDQHTHFSGHHHHRHRHQHRFQHLGNHHGYHRRRVNHLQTGRQHGRASHHHDYRGRQQARGQNVGHHHHNFAFRYSRYDSTGFTNVSSDLQDSSFQRHLSSISGCHTHVYAHKTPNLSTTTARTNADRNQCAENGGACADGPHWNTHIADWGVPHSRAACTVTFNVDVVPPWTTTQMPGSKSVAMDNAA